MPESGISPAVLAAQNRLLELRRQLGVSPVAPATCPLPPAPGPLPPATTPFHSENLARHLQAAAARRERREMAESREWLNQIRDTKYEIRDTKYEIRNTKYEVRNAKCDSGIARSNNQDTDLDAAPATLDSYLVSRISYLVRVYPDIALAMLRRKLAAPGRVWLLLRHHDAAGRGRLSLDEATRLLTGDGSPLHICGRRQLQNLLAAGEGVFWQRDTARDGRVYLRLFSAARAAAALGVARLGGSPVAVPLAALTGSIGDVRAHLYASFHSGRQRRDFLTGETRPRGPIARSTMTTLSAAAPNSQRHYERRAGVGRRTAFAVGPRLGAADEQEMAWTRGRALFHYHDQKGRFGRPGAVYLAWQLPNEYTGPHATLPRGRMKRHNRALADLLVDGMTGNSEQNPATRAKTRRFFGTAKAAALARSPGEKYWRHGRGWLWQPNLEIRNDELGITNNSSHTIGIKRWQFEMAFPIPNHQSQNSANQFPIPNS